MSNHINPFEPPLILPTEASLRGINPATTSRLKGPAWVLMLGIACTILSCATSSGSTYSQSVEGESSAAARAAEAKKERQANRPTPTSDQSWPQAESQNRPSQSGYVGYDQSPTILFPIIAPPGSILVQGAPSGAELLVDGLPRGHFMAAGNSTQARTTVEAGQHRIRVKFFGYSTWESDIYVGSNSQASLQADLQPLPFSLRSPNTSGLVFDPSRPGRTGTITAGFSATAPGTATATVQDSSGRILRSLGSRVIDSWSVPIAWDGRDDSGLVVAPGSYTLQLAGSGHGSGPAVDNGPTTLLTAPEDAKPAVSVASAQVTLARLPPLRASSLHGGFSGAMLAPDALILPPGNFQLSTGGYAFIDLEAGSSKARVPVWTGLRVGGFPLPDAELAVSAMLTSYPGYDVYPPLGGISAAASIKNPLIAGDQLAAALIVRAAAATFTDEATSGWPPSWDGAARYPGVGAGVILQWTPGGTSGGTSGGTPGGISSSQAGRTGRASRDSSPGRLFASMEMNAGRFYPGYGDDDGTGVWEVPGFFAWPYARAGLETILDLKEAGRLSIQGSAAARGQPVGTPQGFRPPLSLAGELAWYPPASPFVLHLYGVGEWERFYSWYFAGGVGISVLY